MYRHLKNNNFCFLKIINWTWELSLTMILWSYCIHRWRTFTKRISIFNMFVIQNIPLLWCMCLLWLFRWWCGGLSPIFNVLLHSMIYKFKKAQMPSFQYWFASSYIDHWCWRVRHVVSHLSTSVAYALHIVLFFAIHNLNI